MDISQARIVSAASQAGLVIRYAFYLTGAAVMTMIGIGILSIWSTRVTRLDEPPRFRLTAPSLARLPETTQVVTGGKFGRVEVRSYGQITDRDTDLTIAMLMPPRSVQLTRDGIPHIPNVRPLRMAQVVSTSMRYDLDTRFGPLRASEMRVDTDGRWKLCLTFVSRFPTDAVYLNGWYCDASGARPNAYQLACMIDQLTLDSTLSSSEADSYLRQRLARTPACAATPVSQTIDTRRPGSQPSPPARWSMPNALQRW
jgi:hypothetical protein